MELHNFQATDANELASPFFSSANDHCEHDEEDDYEDEEGYYQDDSPPPSSIVTSSDSPPTEDKHVNTPDTIKTPAKKKRLSQACDNCRRRKVKCDGIRPSCNKCIQLRITCSYQPRNQKRKQRQGYIEKLENRLIEMEKLLKSQSQANAATESVPPSMSNPDKGMLVNATFSGNYPTPTPLSPDMSLVQQTMLGLMQDVNVSPNNLHLSSGPSLLNSVHPNTTATTAASHDSRMVTTNDYTMPTTSLSPPMPTLTETGLPTDLNPLLAAWMTKVPQAVSNNLVIDPSTVSLLTASPQAATAAANELLLPISMVSSNQLAHTSPSPPLSNRSSSSSSPDSHPALPPSSSGSHMNPPTSLVAAAAAAAVASTGGESVQHSNICSLLPPVPDELLRHLLSLFFTHGYPLGPIIHPPTFYRDLGERRVSPVLLWTMCANAARYSDHPTLQADPSLASGDFFGQRAKEYLVASQATPDVHTVQAVSFLGFFEYALGRPSTAWVYIGMATRMAQSLKLHRVDDPALASRQEADWVTQETKRRTWWLCFLSDRMSSLSSGVPTSIDQRDMAVSLPSSDSDWEIGMPSMSRPNNSALSASETQAFLEMTPGMRQDLPEDSIFSRYSYVLQLTSLMGRVSRYATRPRLGFISPEENTEFEILDATLTSWVAHLPPSLQFSPETGLNRPIGENRYAIHAMCLHIFHLVAVILLHRARCRSLTNNQSDPLSSSSPVSSTDSQGSYANPNSPAHKPWLRCVQSSLVMARIAGAALGGSAVRCHVYQPFSYLTCGTILIRFLNVGKHLDPATYSAAQEGFLVLMRALRECQPYWRLAGEYLAILTGLAAKLLPSSQLLAQASTSPTTVLT